MMARCGLRTRSSLPVGRLLKVPHADQHPGGYEPADGSEADLVVDLADLAQSREVLGDQEDAAGVGEHHGGAAAGDALAGVLRAVALHLLR